jgi:ankyrin repeat-rich membrane spanning protein
VTAAGVQNSVTQMVGSLFEAVEEQYGASATRLYRALKPKPLSVSTLKFSRS